MKSSPPRMVTSSGSSDEMVGRWLFAPPVRMEQVHQQDDQRGEPREEAKAAASALLVAVWDTAELNVLGPSTRMVERAIPLLLGDRPTTSMKRSSRLAMAPWSSQANTCPLDTSRSRRSSWVNHFGRWETMTQNIIRW